MVCYIWQIMVDLYFTDRGCAEMDYFIPRVDDTDELKHRGIKGMKWGVRRKVT